MEGGREKGDGGLLPPPSLLPSPPSLPILVKKIDY